MSPVSHLDEANDTEITLGMGKMLMLFFGLVILCAVFFGMGFTMGKNSLKSTPELVASPESATRPLTTKAREAKPAEAAAQPAPSSPSTATQSSSTEQPSATPTLPPPGQGYFVQVAAVSKQEDAEALVEALKGRQYSAFIANQPLDKLFHVQVGPFTDIKDAESTRSKLVSDGYSPILKK
ncbi:MAG: SPOR domain-containing protein [Acidobacteria bacterium]|nr:SPOR domain-containing protein [Acidobacteriota bacterium]